MPIAVFGVLEPIAQPPQVIDSKGPERGYATASSVGSQKFRVFLFRRSGLQPPRMWFGINRAQQTLGFSPGREAPLKTPNFCTMFSGHDTSLYLSCECVRRKRSFLNHGRDLLRGLVVFDLGACNPEQGFRCSHRLRLWIYLFCGGHSSLRGHRRSIANEDRGDGN